MCLWFKYVKNDTMKNKYDGQWEYSHAIWINNALTCQGLSIIVLAKKISNLNQDLSIGLTIFLFWLCHKTIDFKFEWLTPNSGKSPIKYNNVLKIKIAFRQKHGYVVQKWHMKIQILY